MRSGKLAVIFVAALALSGCDTLGINDATDYVGDVFSSDSAEPAARPVKQTAPPSIPPPAPVAPPPVVVAVPPATETPPPRETTTMAPSPPENEPPAVELLPPVADAEKDDNAMPPANPKVTVPCRMKGEVRLVTAGFCHQMGGVVMQ